jgi:hypothetical protein
LLTADPIDFLERNLRLENVDYDALGRVLGIRQSNWRKVMLTLRCIAYRKDMPVDCLTSPAMIRSMLKAVQVTKYAMDQCFSPLQWGY